MAEMARETTMTAPAVIHHLQFANLPNGTRLHYGSAGEQGKPLILFVHGFPEFWYAWERQLAEFGQTHFAVAPDLRGFNLSSKPASPDAYKPKLLVEDLVQFIRVLGYERCTIVAHDWGGAVGHVWGQLKKTFGLNYAPASHRSPARGKGCTPAALTPR